MPRALVVLALLTLAFGAHAQSYRCTAKDGKKYYGSTVPQECIGQPIEQLSPQGVVMRRFDAQASEQERQAKQAAAVKKQQDDALAKEEQRRNNALLATYTSEKDIEEARGRAIAENEKAIKEIEGRLGEIRKRQAAYGKEMEFYSEGKANDKGGKGKPAAKPVAKAPAKLTEDIKNAEIDMQAQENLLAAKKKEVEGINAKYDEDRKRFLDLTGKDTAGKAKGSRTSATR